MNNIEFKDVEQKIEDLSSRVAKIETIDKIAEKKTELSRLEQLSAAADFWNNPQQAKEASRQIDFLKTL